MRPGTNHCFIQELEVSSDKNCSEKAAGSCSASEAWPGWFVSRR